MSRRHRLQEWLRFLRRLDGEFPPQFNCTWCWTTSAHRRDAQPYFSSKWFSTAAASSRFVLHHLLHSDQFRWLRLRLERTAVLRSRLSNDRAASIAPDLSSRSCAGCCAKLAAISTTYSRSPRKLEVARTCRNPCTGRPIAVDGIMKKRRIARVVQAGAGQTQVHPVPGAEKQKG